MPIALKLTVFLAALVIAAMTWQGYTALGEASRHLEAEVNEQGATLAISMSSLLDPARILDRDRLAEFLRALVGEKGPSELGTPTPELDRIRDVIVFDEAGRILATARSGVRASGQVRTTRRTIDVPLARAAGLEVSELETDGVPVRAFTRELFWTRVRLPEGETSVRARFELLLSAEHILSSRRELSTALRNVLIVSSLAAVVLAALLATLLVRPLRALARDMRAVSQGDLEVQSRIDSNDEIGDLSRTFNHMTTSLLAAQETRLAQRAIEHELQLATSIQSRLMPAEIPAIPGIELAAHYAPAKEVGGDYYDILRVDESRWGFVVADVSGKGVPASLVMTMTRSLVRMASAGRTPGQTLREVNSCLATDLNPGMFVTVAHATLDTRNFEIRLCRAGHNAPLLVQSRQARVVRLYPKGIAIGLDKKGPLFDSQLEMQRFRLLPGDVLILYTDGVVEAKSPDERDYGQDRFESLLASVRDRPVTEILDAVLEDLAEHRQNAEPSDDITLIVLRRLRG